MAHRRIRIRFLLWAYVVVLVLPMTFSNLANAANAVITTSAGLSSSELTDFDLRGFSLSGPDLSVGGALGAIGTNIISGIVVPQRI